MQKILMVFIFLCTTFTTIYAQDTHPSGDQLSMLLDNGLPISTPNAFIMENK